MDRSRRAVLSVLGTSLVWVAGCAGNGQSSADGGEEPTLTGEPNTGTATDGSRSTTDTADGDVAMGTWPMVEYDAGHTNHNANADGFADEPSKQWRQPFAAENSSGFVDLLEPLLANGYLTVEDGTRSVFAVDARTGEVGLEGDSHGLPYEYRGSVPSIAAPDGYYSVGFHRETDTRHFVAHDIGGDVDWEAEIPAGRAVATGDTVFVAVSEDSRPVSGVVALERGSGTERWRQTAETSERAFIAASSDRVFVARPTTLTAYAASSGDRLWDVEMPAESRDAGLGFGRPRSADGYVYLPGAGTATQEPVPRVWAFPHYDPSPEWTWEGEASVVPRVVTEDVVVGDRGQAIDLGSGDRAWSATEFVGELLDGDFGPRRVWDVVASGDSILFATGDSNMAGDVPGAIGAVDAASGESRWQLTIDGGARHLLTGSEYLYVVTHEGAIEAYSSK